MVISANATSTQIYDALENGMFKTWFKASLPSTLTSGMHHTLDVEIPHPFVETDLSNAVFDAVNACRDRGNAACGMRVYYGRHYSGKSVSAKQAIRRARRESGAGVHGYPSVYVNITDSLVNSIRRTLDVPRNMGEDDWVEILFHLLSNRNRVNALPRSLFGIDCGCFGGGSDDSDEEAYTNQPGNLPPMIVLDNLRTLSPDTRHLLVLFYTYARQHRVFALVITDREEVANYIVAMNGDRVEPLENRFHLQAGLRAYNIVPSPDFPVMGSADQTAQGILWDREEWPRSKQHEYLLKFPKYLDMSNKQEHLGADGYFSFLVTGENPEQALGQADEYCLRRRCVGTY